MPNFRAIGIAIVLAAATGARAQQPVRGFAVERLYPSAPGGGWFVMDALDLAGGLGGAVSFGLGYADNPLRVSDGTHRLTVVSDEAAAQVGFAVTWRRWRWYADTSIPLAIFGGSGTVGAYTFGGPAVSLGANPDTLSDTRLGADLRIWGAPRGRFRLGASAQLVVPSGARPDYDSDGTYRGMLRALLAGDAGPFTWAAQLGVHIRPLDDSPAPGSPRGSELLFGAAAGARLPVGHGTRMDVVVGPELFGASAFNGFFTSNGTAFEGLLSTRLEGTRVDRMQVRVKLGIGAGINQHFGAPEWRIVAGVELFNHRAR